MPAVTDIPGIPSGFEQLAPVTATGITAGLRLPTTGSFKASNAVAVLITVEDAPVRYRMDGTDPTADVGHLMQVGDSQLLRGNVTLANLTFIDAGAGGSEVNITIIHPHNASSVSSGI